MDYCKEYMGDGTKFKWKTSWNARHRAEKKGSGMVQNGEKLCRMQHMEEDVDGTLCKMVDLGMEC